MKIEVTCVLILFIIILFYFANNVEGVYDDSCQYRDVLNDCPIQDSCEVAIDRESTGCDFLDIDCSAFVCKSIDPRPPRTCADMHAGSPAGVAFDCSSETNSIAESPENVRCGSESTACVATECCTVAPPQAPPSPPASSWSTFPNLEYIPPPQVKRRDNSRATNRCIQDESGNCGFSCPRAGNDCCFSSDSYQVTNGLVTEHSCNSCLQSYGC